MAGQETRGTQAAPFAGSKRLGIIALALVGAILSVNLIVLLFALDERQRAATAAAREDAVWAAYQVDREAAKLHAVLLRFGGGQVAINEVTTRYDVLYSRTTVLGGGQLDEIFRDPDLAEPAAVVARDILALDPHGQVVSLEHGRIEHEQTHAVGAKTLE